MELADPRYSDDLALLGVGVQLAHFALVDVRLDVVAEVGQEKDLAFAVPQERMLEDLLKHQLSAGLTGFVFVAGG